MEYRPKTGMKGLCSTLSLILPVFIVMLVEYIYPYIYDDIRERAPHLFEPKNFYLIGQEPAGLVFVWWLVFAMGASYGFGFLYE